MEELATTPNPNDITSESNQKQKSVLEAFENIVELAEESALNDDFWEKASSSINYAARKLKLTNSQTVLLALLVDCSMDNCISLSDIVVRTGCRTTRLLRFISEAEELEKKRYIRIRRNRNNKSYRVPAEVIDSLVKDKPYVHIPKPVSDVVDFFDRFDKLMDDQEGSELFYEYMETRMCTECFDFYRAVRRFQDLCADNNREAVRAEFESMKRRFIGNTALTPINISDQLVQEINSVDTSRDIPANVFRAADEDNKKTMMTDLHPRFKQWDKAKAYAQWLRRQSLQ